jgi:hypothetical protein
MSHNEVWIYQVDVFLLLCICETILLNCSCNCSCDFIACRSISDCYSAVSIGASIGITIAWRRTMSHAGRRVFLSLVREVGSVM